MMSSAVSMLSGGISPVITSGAAAASDFVKTGPTMAVEASTPLTFKKVRRFAEGLSLLSGILHHTGMAFLGLEMEILKPTFIGDTISVDYDSKKEELKISKKSGKPSAKKETDTDKDKN